MQKLFVNILQIVFMANFLKKKRKKLKEIWKTDFEGETITEANLEQNLKNVGNVYLETEMIHLKKKHNKIRFDKLMEQNNCFPGGLHLL